MWNSSRSSTIVSARDRHYTESCYSEICNGVLTMCWAKFQSMSAHFKHKINTHTPKYSAHARLCFGNMCGKNFSNNHNTHAKIVSSRFMDGHNVSGLEIYIHHPNISVVIDNVTLQNNTAGNLVLPVTYLGSGKLNISVL